MRALTCLAILGSLSAPLVAGATTYPVGAGQPHSDLAAVASLLKPGDVVELQGDATYPGGVRFRNPGTLAQPITIRGVKKNGKRPVLSGGTDTLTLTASHYVIDGLDITGGTSDCVIHKADDVTIRDTVIHHCPNHGLLGTDADSGSLTLDHVEVHHSGEGDRHHQIYMATDETVYPGAVFRMQHCYVHDGTGGNNVKSRAQRNELYANWIEGAFYHELDLIGPDGQDLALAREDSDVVGNVIRVTGMGHAGRLGGDGTGETQGRYRFASNTIVLVSTDTAFRAQDGIDSIELENNVFVRPGGGPVRLVSDSAATWASGAAKIGGAHNWLPSGSAVPPGLTATILGADPGLVDLAGLDLRPSMTSPLVDAGAVPSSPPGFEQATVLAVPAHLPPPRALEPDLSTTPRQVAGVLDVGAYELGAPAPDLPAGGGDGDGGTGGPGGPGGTGGVGGGAAGGPQTGGCGLAPAGPGSPAAEGLLLLAAWALHARARRHPRR